MTAKRTSVRRPESKTRGWMGWNRNVPGATLAAVLAIGILGASGAALATPAMVVAARTPWGIGPNFTTPPSPLECAQCSFNSASTLSSPRFNSFGFNFLGLGETDVLFPRVWANTAGDASFEYTAPFGTNGVSCAHLLDLVENSTDIESLVSCTNSNGTVVPSRVQLMQRYDVGHTISGTIGDLGYLNYDGTQSGNGTIINWASSSGQAPTVTKYGTGDYGITFNGLNSTSNYGNIQITNRQTRNRNCYLWTFGQAPAYAEVFCFDSTAPAWTWADAGIGVSYSQAGIGTSIGGQAEIFVTDDNPTFAGTYTPSPGFVYTYTSSINPTITRTEPGQYQVNWSLGLQGAAFTPLVSTIVDDAGLLPVCTAVDITKNSVSIDCTVNGLPTDSYFTLEVDSHADTTASLPQSKSGFGLVTAANLGSTFDVSDNLLCANQCPTSPCSNNISCFVGTEPNNTPGTFPLLPTGSGGASPVCNGPPPNGLRGLAVQTNGTLGVADSYDPRNTYIIALGINSVVNYCSGIGSWPISSGPQFSGSWGQLVSPVMEGTGAAVQLRQIVSVRTAGASTPDLLGLTADNTIVQADLPQGKWIPAVAYPVPAVGIVSISHGVNDLYVFAGASGMYRVTKDEASATLLPALPNGLQPVAMGGRFVVTNSGVSHGQYTCTVNGSGDGQCAGDGGRFYRLDGRYGTDVWESTGSATFTPTGAPPFYYPWDLAGATSNPIMPPTIVDAGLMGGDNDSFVIWENQARLYDYYPSL